MLGKITEDVCPHKRHGMLAIDPGTDEVYEGTAMCELVDKCCLQETGDECDTYREFLEEQEKEQGLPSSATKD